MKKKDKIWIYSFLLTGALILFSLSCKKDNNNKASNTITDGDGNIYDTLSIGTQVWLVENLKTTKYNDGTEIPLITDKYAWQTLISPGYCWYNNDSAGHKKSYGALYNWYAINTGKLCPKGWHIPTRDEWIKLTEFLGGDSIAGGKLKEMDTIYWLSPNTGATNESGFTGLPGGQRIYHGEFTDKDGCGYWWSATPRDMDNAWFLTLWNNKKKAMFMSDDKRTGNSVRCIKD